MSKIIATAAIRGAHKIYNQAEESLAKAIEEKVLTIAGERALEGVRPRGDG